MPVIRKRFGQHFLEPAWVDKVIRAIDPKPDELFIEIGPGRGALTRPLAARAKSVVAFEIDRDLAAALEADAPSNLTVIVEDFLEPDWYMGFDPHQVPRVIRVAGNLPYNVASPILFKLVEQHRTYAANGLPFGDATFDLVFCDHGATSFTDPHVTIPESARVLRPGGLLVFDMATPFIWIAWRVPAGAEGSLGSPSPAVSSRRPACGRQGRLPGDGPGRVYASP